MTITAELKEREAAYKELYAIKITSEGYTLTEEESYFSDSCNPKGEWVSYTSEIKTYKTLNGAIKALRKLISCHFPAGYDIEEVVQAICKAAA